MGKKKQKPHTQNQPIADKVDVRTPVPRSDQPERKRTESVQILDAATHQPVNEPEPEQPKQDEGAGEQLGYQERVDTWLRETFGERVPYDKTQRNHRFLEEALELVQACHCSREEAHKLVDYVFSRPRGELRQEVGGAVLSLAALCNAQGVNMDECGEAGLQEVWERIPEIREKQANIPMFSALPR